MSKRLAMSAVLLTLISFFSLKSLGREVLQLSIWFNISMRVFQPSIRALRSLRAAIIPVAPLIAAETFLLQRFAAQKVFPHAF